MGCMGRCSQQALSVMFCFLAWNGPLILHSYPFNPHYPDVCCLKEKDASGLWPRFTVTLFSVILAVILSCCVDSGFCFYLYLEAKCMCGFQGGFVLCQYSSTETMFHRMSFLVYACRALVIRQIFTIFGG